MKPYDSYAEARVGAQGGSRGAEWRVMANWPNEAAYLRASRANLAEEAIYVQIGRSSAIGLSIRQATELAKALILEAEFFNILDSVHDAEREAGSADEAV